METFRETSGKCRGCKKTRPLRVFGEPPNECTAECTKCGRRWRVCGARRKNGPCLTSPIKDKLRCRICGGLSPGGKIVHGRRARTMPAQWAAHALEAMDDPDLVSCRANLAALEGMICSLQEEIKDEKTGTEIAADAAAALAKVTKAVTAKDSKAMVSALSELQSAIEATNAREKKIDRYLDLMERQRKQQDTEIRRLSALNQYVTAHQLAAFFARLRADVLELVSNKDERMELARRIAGYFGRASSE